MSMYSGAPLCGQVATIAPNTVDNLIDRLDANDKDLENVLNRIKEVRKRLLGGWPEREEEKVPAGHLPGDGFMDRARNRINSQSGQIAEIKTHLAELESICTILNREVTP